MAESSWLRDYFKRLTENISNSEISSESALTATVEFPLSGWGKGKTLLQALRYEKSSVLPQFQVKGIGTAKPKVDFLIGDKPNRWMLELKKPSDTCERSKYVEQLQSYMIQENIALGVLFNGKQALLYVNPEHNSVSNISHNIKKEEIDAIPDLDLNKSPIKRASIDAADFKDMINFFRLFIYDEKLLNIPKIAFDITDLYVKKLRQDAKIKMRYYAIQKAFFEILKNPDELMLDSIIKASRSLTELKTKTKELSDIWGKITFS